MISKPVVRGRAFAGQWPLTEFAVFETKNTKQRRLIAAILRKRRKSSRRRASPTQQFPHHAAIASNSHELSQPMADRLTLQDLRKFDIPAYFVFAYKRTGLLVTVETEASMSPCDLRCWHAAVLEYFRIERQKKAGTANGTLH
jgi:hypothetical protein